MYGCRASQLSHNDTLSLPGFSGVHDLCLRLFLCLFQSKKKCTTQDTSVGQTHELRLFQSRPERPSSSRGNVLLQQSTKLIYSRQHHSPSPRTSCHGSPSLHPADSACATSAFAHTKNTSRCAIMHSGVGIIIIFVFVWSSLYSF